MNLGAFYCHTQDVKSNTYVVFRSKEDVGFEVATSLRVRLFNSIVTNVIVFL